MRPRRLRIEGFTCYREVQEIDFAPLDLFAIAGPTGAGKTSILDAMVFALYGEVPRMGAQRLGELISLGLERASAMFEFELGTTAYRITRTMRRKGAAQAILERVAGSATPIAEGVRGVEAEVKRLLGIDASTFLKAVVLPQGKFHEFLHSKPAERRAIVRALLQLEAYERMRERAGQLARQAAGDAEAIRARLDEDYRDATAERIAEIEAELARVAVQLERAAEAARIARGRREALERAAELQARFRAACARVAELDARKSHMDEMTRALERAEVARPVLALLQARDAAAAEHDVRRRALSDVVERVTRATAVHEAAATALDAARAAARELDELHGRSGRLEQLEPTVARRQDLARRLAEATRAQELAAERCKQADARRTAAERRLHECSEQLASVRAQLAASPHDAERLRTLEQALAPAARCETQRRIVEQARVQYERARGALTTAEQAVELARRREAEEVAAEIEAAGQVKLARERQQLVEHQHRAHVLRSSLTAGAACPVCLQAVVSVPPPQPIADLEQAKTFATEAERVHREVAERARGARTTREIRERDLERARGDARDAEQQLASARAELDELERALVALVGEHARDDVARLHAEARARGEAHARLANAEQQAIRAVEDARHALEMAEADLRSALLDREREAANHSLLAEQVAELDTQIRAVAPSGDPVEERRRLARRIAELVSRRDEAERAEQQARADLDALDKQRVVADTAMRAAAANYEAASARVRDALSASRFASEGEARAAALPEQECEQIARDIETWKAARAVAATEASQLEREAPAEEITTEQLDEAREREQRTEGEHRLLLQQQATRQRDREQLTKLAAKAQELRERLQHREREWATYDQLSSDLRTDRFQAFLLDDTFRELVAGASVRLRELSSGRYSLDYGGDDFFVIDHDNARERRRAETLSGGETFLTALALALQLSEQIQRAAGAVRLDSLFIDEGFGTLDPETLGTVADAIQQLGRGRRMVGIITHVPELTAALPARLEIRRTATGARVETVLEA